MQNALISVGSDSDRSRDQAVTGKKYTSTVIVYYYENNYIGKQTAVEFYR
jgi:hypothetical protein